MSTGLSSLTTDPDGSGGPQRLLDLDPSVPDYEYAYYFPEGSGYLYVKKLGRGADGVAIVVWSCAEAELAYHRRDIQANDGHADVVLDKVHFVRKKTRPQVANLFEQDGDYWPNPLEEIRHYRIHQNIPGLVDWVEYHPLRRNHEDHLRFTAHSMIFRYCNGGTLREVIRAYQRWNQDRIREAERYQPGLTPEAAHVPESFIFIFFGQLLQVVNWLHHQRPGVQHGDIHAGNLFLHFSRPGQSLPDCFLGDFGRSLIIDPTHWNLYGVPASHVPIPSLEDYENIWMLLVELMTLRLDADSRQLRALYDTLRDDQEYYSELLFNQIRKYQNLTDDAQADGQNPDFASFARRLIAYGQGLAGLSPESLKNTYRRNPGDPLTFQTCAELLQHAEEERPAGPYKIAKIRKDTKAVVALSREVYQTYLPSSRLADTDYGHVLRGDAEHSIPRSERDMSVARM